MTQTEQVLLDHLEKTEWKVDEAAIAPSVVPPTLGLPGITVALGVANALVAAYNKGKADAGG